jgi:ectoine hydroxylase-related dioxygenase (phytanoyl-CoA dioxygenase family)
MDSVTGLKGTTTGLTPQQVAFFETFGYLKLSGLFADQIDDIIAGFEEVFAGEGHIRMELYEALHGEERRLIIPQFVTKSPRLSCLLDDARVVGIVRSLLGDEYEYAESDGNLFDCESTWHSDIYGAPMHMHHVKLSFYLDPLRADSGAIRVMPGTNFFNDPFALNLRKRMKDVSKIEEEFGVPDRELPSVVLETDPGDVVVWDFRTIHASFYGRKRRRLFSINFRERQPEQDAARA